MSSPPPLPSTRISMLAWPTSSAAWPATGWYVPVGLPDEWKLQAAAIQSFDYGDDSCPCQLRLWVNEDPSAAIWLHQSRSDAPEVSDLFEAADPAGVVEGIDLGVATATAGSGVFADGPQATTLPFVAWQHDGTRTVLYGTGLSQRQLIDAAHGVVWGDDAGPPLPGFRLTDQTQLLVGSGTAVEVHVSAPAVNGPDLASDAFTISASWMTEEQAKGLAAAINAG